MIANANNVYVPRVGKSHKLVWSDLQISDIITTYASGVSSTIIAKKYSCDPVIIRNVLHKYSIAINKRSIYPRTRFARYNFDLGNIQTFYNSGLGIKEIAAKYGCSYKHMWDYFGENKISRRSRGKKGKRRSLGLSLNKEWILKRTKAKNLLYKTSVFGTYNFKCSICGLQDFVHIDIFGLDHTNNDAHHYLTGVKGGQKLYRDLYYSFVSKNLPIPNTYQLLCHNCNWLKHLKYSQSLKHGSQYEVQQRYHEKLQREVFMRYSPNLTCQCCNYNNINALQLAHIIPIRSRDRPCGVVMWRYLLKNNCPPGYKILCANCNMYEYINGKCFHQELKEKETKESAAMIV